MEYGIWNMEYNKYTSLSLHSLKIQIRQLLLRLHNYPDTCRQNLRTLRGHRLPAFNFLRPGHSPGHLLHPQPRIHAQVLRGPDLQTTWNLIFRALFYDD